MRNESDFFNALPDSFKGICNENSNIAISNAGSGLLFD